MRLHATWALAAALLFLASCGPGGSSPYQIVVLVFNPSSRVYEPRTVSVTTLTDVGKLQGSAATLVGGAKFVLDNATGGSADELLAQVTKNPGGNVNASYIESQGALVPADFHSLNMATTYYNFERAHDFFVNKLKGTLTETRYGVPNVYYFPEFIQGGQAVLDNAMFMALAKGFFILPFKELQQVPMAINQGIVGHEYSHSVFNYNVEHSDPLSQVVWSWMTEFGATPGANLMASLDEGSADLFGTGTTCSDDLVTCDTEFMGSSLPVEYLDMRRIDKPQCMDEGMWNNLENLAYAEFTDAWTRCTPYGCHYKTGTVFASALWRAASDTKVVAALGQGGARRQMFQALWNAQSGAGGSPELRSWGDLMNSATVQSEFSLKKRAGSSLPSVLDAVIDGATDPAMKAALCSAFMDRFGLYKSDFARCPTESVSTNECQRQ